MNDLTVSRFTTPSLAENPAERLYRAFLESQTANTRVAYAQDVSYFAAFVGEPSATAAIALLLTLSGGDGNAMLLDFKSHMTAAGQAPATINRRLSALRSAVKLARTLGFSTWTPEIAGVRAQTYRDTAGPGLNGTRTMLGVAREQDSVKASRDIALIRLMFDLGLRRGECVNLDLNDVDRERRRIWILGKGHRQKEARTLPEPTFLALAAWLERRASVAQNDEPALFVGLSKTGGGRRITGRGVHYVISGIGNDAGLKTRPHGLRHASITTALDVNNGDVRAAQQHARHASPETTMRYDDNRRDLAGRVADSIAGLV